MMKIGGLFSNFEQVRIFLGGGSRQFCKMVNIFTYTCPNHSGVSAIDSPDRLEHVLHPYCILEALENFFGHELWIVRAQKLAKIGFYCRF